jgi:lysozyme
MSETTKLEREAMSTTKLERNAMSETKTTKLELAIYMSGLRYDEGLQLTPYKVSNGPWAIGYGHKLTPAEMRVKRDLQITLEQAEKLLLEDTVRAICDARVVCGSECFNVLSLPRKSVLVNMAFHLGRHRLKRLKKFLSALQAYDYNAAAAAIIKSKWIRGARARRLIGLMQHESDISLT